MNGYKHMKTCSASLVSRELQIKTVRQHPTPLEWLKFKRLAIPSVDVKLTFFFSHFLNSFIITKNPGTTQMSKTGN